MKQRSLDAATAGFYVRYLTYTSTNDDRGNVNGFFSIGELAAELSLSPRAIRFYEDQGLLSPQRAGTTRIYSKRDRARLQLILRGKRLGFSLSDIREFLNLYDADRSKRRQMAMTLERTRGRIGELEQQLDDITVTLAELRDMEGEILAYMRSDDAERIAEMRTQELSEKGVKA